MSTRTSLQYWAIGSYRWRTEFSWHLYLETRDDRVRLEVTAFGYPVLNIPAWWR